MNGVQEPLQNVVNSSVYSHIMGSACRQCGRTLTLTRNVLLHAGWCTYVCMYVLVPVVNVLADMHLLPSYCCCRAAAPEIRVRSELI